MNRGIVKYFFIVIGYICILEFDDEVRKVLFATTTLERQIAGGADPDCGFVETCRSFYADESEPNYIWYCRCKYIKNKYILTIM